MKNSKVQSEIIRRYKSIKEKSNVSEIEIKDEYGSVNACKQVSSQYGDQLDSK